MRIFNLKSLIDKSKEIYNDRYDYKNTLYVNAKTKCIFICNIHNHIFEQTPNHHLTSFGCKFCIIENKRPKMNHDDFIKKAETIYGDKFSYGEYKSAKKEISITCKKHNFIFQQMPVLHYQYNGCLMCRQEDQKTNFINKATILHNGIYDYSLVENYNTNNKVKIICSTHGIFEQTPNIHMQGKGCKSCSKTGFDYASTESYFYIQELLSDNVCIGYKFGITKNISKRLMAQKSKSKLEHKLIYSYKNTGMNVYNLEKTIKDNIKYNHLTKEIIPDGYTETISPDDILQLENIIIDFLTGEINE